MNQKKDDKEASDSDHSDSDNSDDDEEIKKAKARLRQMEKSKKKKMKAAANNNKDKDKDNKDKDKDKDNKPNEPVMKLILAQSDIDKLLAPKFIIKAIKQVFFLSYCHLYSSSFWAYLNSHSILFYPIELEPRTNSRYYQSSHL